MRASSFSVLGSSALGLALAGLAALTACAKGLDDPLGYGDLPAVDASVDAAEGGPRGTTLPGRDGSDGTDEDADVADDDAASADAGRTDAGRPDAGPGPVDAGTDSGPVGGCVTTAPSNACGLVAQCGCAANQTCAITTASTGAVSCVAAGATAVGNPCTTQSQCARGTTCTFGACRPYCATADQPCAGAAGTLCFAPEDANGNTSPNLKVCTTDCNPRVPSTACGSNACQWFSGERVSDCRPAGTSGRFVPCDYASECMAGFGCSTHPYIVGKECERWCRVGQAGDCLAGEVCVNTLGANAPKENGVTLGFCQD